MKKIEGLSDHEREVAPTQFATTLIKNTVSELNKFARAKGNYYGPADVDTLKKMEYIAGSIDPRVTLSPQQQVLVKQLLLGYFGQRRDDIHMGAPGEHEHTSLSIAVLLNSFKKDAKTDRQSEDLARISARDFLANFSRQVQSEGSQSQSLEKEKISRLNLLSLITESSKSGVMLNVAQQKLLEAVLSRSLYYHGKSVHGRPYELDLEKGIDVGKGVLEAMTFINSID